MRKRRRKEETGEAQSKIHREIYKQGSMRKIIQDSQSKREREENICWRWHCSYATCAALWGWLSRNINVYILVLRLLLKTFTATATVRASARARKMYNFYSKYLADLSVHEYEYELNIEVYLPCTYKEKQLSSWGCALPERLLCVFLPKQSPKHVALLKSFTFEW